eukprot:TRINITY_DN563_c0_g1_i3.p1 TRINITY_DN563_c0_g1~~TRINITY_DN563_c0_g1_i3.p1  ORF type:complete len:1226 (+),score=205.76 TRINITY_DN563_c0_g1_i3:970-4647(+)
MLRILPPPPASDLENQHLSPSSPSTHLESTSMQHCHESISVFDLSTKTESFENPTYNKNSKCCESTPSEQFLQLGYLFILIYKSCLVLFATSIVLYFIGRMNLSLSNNNMRDPVSPNTYRLQTDLEEAEQRYMEALKRENLSDFATIVRFRNFYQNYLGIPLRIEPTPSIEAPNSTKEVLRLHNLSAPATKPLVNKENIVTLKPVGTTSKPSIFDRIFGRSNKQQTGLPETTGSIKCKGVHNKSLSDFASSKWNTEIKIGNEIVGKIQEDPESNTKNYFSTDCSGNTVGQKYRCHSCKTLYNNIKSHRIRQDRLERRMGNIQEDTLISEIRKTFRNYDNYGKSFNYQFNLSQFKFLNSKPNGYRWPKCLLRFGASIQWRGGPSTIHVLKGKQFAGQGKSSRKISIDDFGLCIPSHQTIRRYQTKINPYNNLIAERCQILRGIIEGQGTKLSKESMFMGGLVADEIEIKHGLQFDRHRNQLYGLSSGPITAENMETYSSLSEQDFRSRFASKVLMVFFVSCDGSITIPIGCFPRSKHDKNPTVTSIKSTIDELEKNHIGIIWGSSDGWDTNLSFVKQIEEHCQSKGCSYYHIFDYIHLVKNGRNYFRNNIVFDEKIGFSLRTLWKVWEDPNDKDYEALHKLVHLNDLKISDPMDMDPVRKLLQPALVDLLLKREELNLQALGKYLFHLGEWNRAFERNGETFEKKIEQLRISQLYFKKLGGNVSDAFKLQTEQTIKSLIGLQHYLEENNQQLNNISYLGTNVVENYFSVIREKVHFPNLYEFWSVQQKAWNELIKRYNQSPDFNPLIKGPKNRAYGALPIGTFTQEQLPFQKSQFKLKKKSTPNSEEEASNLDHLVLVQKMKEFAEKFRPTRQILTIREVTCKVNPTAKKFDLGYHHCPFDECVKTYVYRGSYISHVLKKHGKTQEEALESLNGALLSDAILEDEIDKEPAIFDAVLPVDPTNSDSVYNELMINPGVCSSNTNIVFLDTETTGMQGQQIVEISAVCFGKGSFYSLVRPDSEIHSIYGTQKHKLTVSDLQKERTWKEIGPLFLNYLKNEVNGNIIVVAHNVSFDKNVILKEFERCNLKFDLDMLWVCSEKIIKEWIPGLSSYSLEKLCTLFNITQTRAHRALFDVQTMVEVLSKANQFKFPASDFREKIQLNAESVSVLKLNTKKPQIRWNEKDLKIILDTIHVQSSDVDWQSISRQVNRTIEQCKAKRKYEILKQK